VPYASNDALPESVRRVLPAAAQTVFRNVFNSVLSGTESEERAFRGAWSTLRRQGWEPDDEGMWRKVEKVAPRAFESRFVVSKLSPAEGRVFGWAYVCERGGEAVTDHSGERILAAELEPAVTRESGVGGDMHKGEAVGVGELIETVFVNGEKWAAMGVPGEIAKTLPVGWWVGFQYDPNGEPFANVKSGDRLMFSIGGGYEELEEVAA
jgi:cation transport regulator